MEAQSLRTKQAEVEFHNFASLGEPETAIRVYAEENARRGAVLGARGVDRFLYGRISKRVVKLEDWVDCVMRLKAERWRLVAT